MNAPAQRPMILLSGGKTTTGLTPLLLKHFDVAIIDQGIGQAQAQRYGNKVVPIVAFLDDAVRQRAIASSFDIVRHILNKHVDGVVEEIESLPQWKKFRGNGFGANLHEWFVPRLQNAVLNQVLVATALERLGQSRQVLMFVTHEDVTETMRFVTLRCKHAGIPTMHVPHANYYMLPSHGPDIHEESVSDFAAVTPYMETWLRERNFVGETKVTGSPNFDRWVGYERDKAFAQKVLKLDPARKTVVYASSWGQRTNAKDDPNCFEHALHQVLRAASAQGWQLIIKMHPGEAPELERVYIETAQKYRAPTLITRQYLEVVLTAADAMIALGASNVVVDAALMNVPAVCINMPGYRFQHPAVVELEDPSSAILGEAVNSVIALSEEARAKSLGALIARDVGLPNDGKATRRVARWITELV